jgi:hypothetical protein
MGKNSLQLRRPLGEYVTEFTNEAPIVKLGDKSVYPSQFGVEQITTILEGINLSESRVTDVIASYALMKEFFRGKKYRRDGTPAYNHLKSVFLKLILEGGSVCPIQMKVALHHDSVEDVFNDNKTPLIGDTANHRFQRVNILSRMIGFRVARQVMALSKPDNPKPKNEMTEDEMDEFIYQYCLQILIGHNEHPLKSGEPKSNAQVKIIDRVTNLQTMGIDSEARQALYLLESIRFLTHIAEIAGEPYRSIFAEEVDKRIDLLTIFQKSQAKEIIRYPYGIYKNRISR